MPCQFRSSTLRRCANGKTPLGPTGQTEAEVIRRVGKRLARRARKLTRADDFILILAGKGHNGDDARAAKEFLDDRKVKVLELLLPRHRPAQTRNDAAEKPALVIDGIFGIGLNRPLAEPWQKIIAAVNAAKIPVLAVDVPSGLNADTGETFGAAIEAAVTLTIGAPKTGMLARNGLAVCRPAGSGGRCRLDSLSASSRIELDAAGGFSKFSARRDCRRHTKVRSAMWRSSRAAWVFTARRCWRRAGRNARSPDW